MENNKLVFNEMSTHEKNDELLNMSKVLGLNIRYYRLKLNMSQPEVAAQMGYKSHTTIQKWETGENIPPYNKLLQLANIFNIDINALTNGIPILDPSSNKVINVLSSNEKKSSPFDVSNFSNIKITTHSLKPVETFNPNTFTLKYDEQDEKRTKLEFTLYKKMRNLSENQLERLLAYVDGLTEKV